MQSYIDKHGRRSTRRWNENLNFESYHKMSRTETGERKVFNCTKNNFNFLSVACDENYCIKDEKECMMRKIEWKVKEITLIRRDCRAKKRFTVPKIIWISYLKPNLSWIEWMQRYMSGFLCHRHNQYIRSIRDRLGFYAEIKIIFGTVYLQLYMKHIAIYEKVSKKGNKSMF